MFAPMRHWTDPTWRDIHTERELWEDVQKSIHRGSWVHDEAFDVGMYGGKEWAEWIMGRVQPGTAMGCIGGGPCHSETSMQLISNQDVGGGADRWLGWWSTNKEKSQVEWIREGFAVCGVKVDVPPNPKQTEALLTILGQAPLLKPGGIPDHLRYNGFRWLRDTGFNAMAFAQDRPHSPLVNTGLLQYACFEERWPRASKVGMLSFSPPEGPIDFPLFPHPRWALSWYWPHAYAMIFIPGGIGVILMTLTLRKKKNDRVEQPDRGERG
jgi:hypothetical protein